VLVSGEELRVWGRESGGWLEELYGNGELLEAMLYCSYLEDSDSFYE